MSRHPQAVKLFVSSKKSQGLDAQVLKRYERELGRLGEFLSRRGRIFPHDISLEDFTEFRTDWSEQYPSSRQGGDFRPQSITASAFVSALRL